jgi:hypothetical protein
MTNKELNSFCARAKGRTHLSLCLLVAGSALLSCRLQHADELQPVDQPSLDRSIVDAKLPVRLTYGSTKSTYSDKQANDSSKLQQSVDKVSMVGKRAAIEGYPILNQGQSGPTYGYFSSEYREDLTDEAWWQKQRTYSILFGAMPTPNWPITPVIGVFRSWNELVLSSPDMPDVTKVDVIALLVGVDYIHNFWTVRQDLSLFTGLKAHLLNPGSKSTGYEGEVMVGAKFVYGPVHTDFTLGYTLNRYNGEQQAPNGEGMLLLKSTQRSTYGMVSFWL